MHRATPSLAAASALLAITTAPIASASPGEQPCSDAVGSTSCQRPGNAQVYTAPRTLPRFLPPTINPRWRALGYSARFPKYGFDPEWQAFGYNPKYSGFQPRPSVLRTSPTLERGRGSSTWPSSWTVIRGPSWDGTRPPLRTPPWSPRR